MGGRRDHGLRKVPPMVLPRWRIETNAAMARIRQDQSRKCMVQGRQSHCRRIHSRRRSQRHRAESGSGPARCSQWGTRCPALRIRCRYPLFATNGSPPVKCKPALLPQGREVRRNMRAPQFAACSPRDRSRLSRIAKLDLAFKQHGWSFNTECPCFVGPDANLAARSDAPRHRRDGREDSPIPFLRWEWPMHAPRGCDPYPSAHRAAPRAEVSAAPELDSNGVSRVSMRASSSQR